MPVRARLSKSGEKTVAKKKRSNISGRLNRAARSVSRAEAADLTPGVPEEAIKAGANRTAKKKQSAILGNRRRRH